MRAAKILRGVVPPDVKGRGLAIFQDFFRFELRPALAYAIVLCGVTSLTPAIGQTTSLIERAPDTASESIIVKAEKRLLKERNSPSAVTELGSQRIGAAGISGSPSTLLRQAPSIYVYQQGIGDNAPELTIRGVRGLETAATLDGVPIQDLLAPGGNTIANNIGGKVTLSEIAGASIFPGVAYPDISTFGTIGGTIAYQSKRPSNDYFVDVTGTIGSFGTYRQGFLMNSGTWDSPLGSADNALKILLNYQNLQNNGFIDFTGSRENEMEFAVDKPYDDGLSKFQATVIYNQATGLLENEPVPVPYLQKYGLFSNYPDDLDFDRQHNQNLSVILKQDHTVNDMVQVGLTAFYMLNDNRDETYGDIGLLVPAGATPSGALAKYVVGGAFPFVTNAGGFGEGGLFGPPMPAPYGFYGGGYGGVLYGKANRYNPYALYPASSKYCPNSLVNLYGGIALAPCGLNDQIGEGHSDTFGVQPRFTLTPPDIDGIGNTIKLGALLAKETSPNGRNYLGGVPQSNAAVNETLQPSGGDFRTIFLAYVQDKVDLLGNTLHVTPGLTVEGTASGVDSDDVFDSKQSPAYGPNGLLSGLGCACLIDRYGPLKASKWDRETLPFVSLSYDFGTILPRIAGLSAYGSFGNSALFSPLSDFVPNPAAPAPDASIVHMYEGGVKYDVSTLLLSADYFYQKIDRDFGYFSYQSGLLAGEADYSGYGRRETKGFEAAATWQVTSSLQVFGNVSHLLAKYLTTGFSYDTVAEEQYGIAFKGTPVTGVPDWLSTFGVDYARRNTLIDADSLDLRLTGQYTGHQYTSDDLGPESYLHMATFPGLASLDYTGCTGEAGNPGCLAYARYNQVTGSTAYDPHGGIEPFVIFGVDGRYQLPTPHLPGVKTLTFDLNVQNLLNKFYWQYFYRQVSPTPCGYFAVGTGPFGGLPRSSYSCSRQFADGIPGQPFSVFFSVTARF
jgi:iron complex outermembrane receptor protein